MKLNMLPKAPSTITLFKEIAIQYQTHLSEAFNNLSIPEKIFIYYMQRASLPGNRIAADQIHRHALTIINIFEELYIHQNILRENHTKTSGDISRDRDKDINIDLFIEEVKTFLVYLSINHGLYFAREHAHEKRTPARLNLHTLTYETLLSALTIIDFKDAQAALDQISSSLFDRDYESTATVPNSIEKSAVNFYSPDFTYEDYCILDPEIRSKLNAYFYIDKTDSIRTPQVLFYSTQEKYSAELTVSAYWLTRAYKHVQKNPEHFDNHTAQSLCYLIEFLKTGDESFFKKHSIEWLQSNNRVDYNFGFIETYQDPQSHRGSFQAEITIKTISINTLNTVLPELEKLLPFKQEFKRVSLKVIPNASINTQVFGTGDLGPQKIVAAYCLPNYEDIRCDYGSKQIIYEAQTGLSTLLNPTLSRQLGFLSEQTKWLEKYDKDHEFINDLWNIHCILHETIGHASGKLGSHAFKKGDNLIIENKKYDLGDTVPVTTSNLKELLAGYEQTLEELRAEIIALYISIEHIDILIEHKLLKNWDTQLSISELQSWLIIEMAQTGLRRLLEQPEKATILYGDHARANYTILNYLLAYKGLELIVEDKQRDAILYKVPGLRIKNLALCIKTIKELMIKVQDIKSTGDGQQAKELIEIYGTIIKDPLIMEHLKTNNKALVGDLKTTAYIYPRLIPLCKDQDMKDQDIKYQDIIDIQATWFSDIFDQHIHGKAQAMKTTLF